MAPKLPLPRGWKRRVQSAVLHILALAATICWNNRPSTAHLDQYTATVPTSDSYRRARHESP